MKRIVAVLTGCSIAATCALAAPPVTLKTTEFGRGPTIVLLHGLGSSRTSWLPTARKLLATYRVVMMDLPGHGDSPLPDPFSLEATAEAVAQGLTSYKPESTVVVGQGLGGMIALMAAGAHPERLRGVLMIDASLKSEQAIPDQQQRYFIQYLEGNYDQVLKMMYTRMGRDSAQGVALHAQAAQVPAVTIKAYMKALLGADQTRLLKDLKPAFLFLGTEKRWPADKGWAAVSKQWGIEGVDSTRARRLADCGPLIASEQPDSLAAILRGFSAQALAKK
jgi:pimeloyl-ACP methyl ester carboxylesterase